MPGPIVTLLQRCRDALDHLVVGAALHQQARARRAALAGVLDQRLHDRGDRLVEVGVGEDDVGGLAAELELDRDQASRAGLGDLRAGRGGADERHVVDGGVARQRRAGRAVAGRDLDQPARHARLLGQLGEAQRGDRGQLGRLDDHGVAGRERGRGAAGRDLQRVVPGDDLRAHAPRLAQRVVQDVGAERDLAAFQALGRARVVVEVADRRLDVGLGLLERLAGVAALELGELVVLGLDRAGQVLERLRTCQRFAPLGVQAEHLAGDVGHVGDLLRGGRGQLGELVPGGRVDGHEGRSPGHLRYARPRSVPDAGRPLTGRGLRRR